MLVDQDNAIGLLYGTVVAVDGKACRIRVRFDERDGLLSPWLEVPQRNTKLNKHRSLPDMGAYVGVLMSANGLRGIYAGSIFSDSDPAPVTDLDTEYVRFADGTTCSYSRAAHELKVHCVGDVNVYTKNTATLTADTSVLIKTPDAEMTGNLTVQKLLTVQGGMSVKPGSGSSGPTLRIAGNVAVEGDVDATGKIMDRGGNSNNHKH